MLNCMVTYRSSGQKAGAVTYLDILADTMKNATVGAQLAETVKAANICRIDTAKVTGNLAKAIMPATKVGDRPYRVNSGNISLRRS